MNATDAGILKVPDVSCISLRQSLEGISRGVAQLQQSPIMTTSGVLSCEERIRTSISSTRSIGMYKKMLRDYNTAHHVRDDSLRRTTTNPITPTYQTAKIVTTD